MPWGTLRQHSTGATWENSSSTIHHSRIFGFLPNFKHTSSLTNNNAISGDAARRRRTQKSTQPRGAYLQPAVSVSRPQHTRSRTMHHPSTYPVRSSVRPPPSMYDDPAFSADPRSHPQFSATKNDRSRMPARQVDNSFSREQPISRSESGYEISESFALLAPPRGQSYPRSSSNQSLLTSESATTYASTTSSDSPSSSGSHTSNNYSFAVKQPTSASITFPGARSNSSSQHSSRYEESDPPVHRDDQRLAGARNISEPDLHQPPPVAAQAPRPMTAPVQDADSKPKPPQRENTRRHNPQRSVELDRIDELDETDPFGGGVHHRGPYEAINAILSGPTNPSNNDGSAGNGFNYGVSFQKQKSKKHAEPVMSPEGPVFDPSVSLNLVPGQVLPKPLIIDLGALGHTPYHYHHRSHSAPPPPPGIEAPPRHNDRQPSHSRHSPHGPQEWPEVRVDSYERQQLPSLQPQSLSQPPSRPHSRSRSRSHSQSHAQPPPVTKYPSQYEPQEWPEVQRDSYQAQHLTQPPSRPHSRSQSQSYAPPPRQTVPDIRVQPPPESEFEYQRQRQAPESQPQQYQSPQPPVNVKPQPHSHSYSQPYPLPHPHSQTHLQTQSYPHQPPPEFQQRLPPRSESQESEPRSQPQPHRHQSRSSNRLVSTSSISSRRSSHYGPTPHHVPRHLVMPTPLQPSNVSHESTSSRVRFHDHGPLSAKVNLQPRAEEISMAPEGRKLLRKRTMTHPVTAPSLRGGKPPPSASSKSLFNILGPRVQEPLNITATKEKGHRRLSKRRNDL